MDICLYSAEIGICPLSIAQAARTFADGFHSGYNYGSICETIKKFGRVG